MINSTNEHTLNGLELRYALSGHGDLISDIVWSADGQTFASSSYDRSIILWHLENGEAYNTLKGRGKSGSVKTVAWSADGRELVAGSTAKNLKVWDLKTGKSNSRQEHSGSINRVRFSPDGQMRASGSSDKTIRVCDANNGKLLWTFKEHTGNVIDVAWSPNGQTLASGSSDKTIRLWSVKGGKAQSGKLLRTFYGHTGDVLSVAWSPNGQILASSSGDCTVRIWDYKKKRLQTVLEGHTGEVTRISFSFDGRLLASKSTDGSVRLWRCDTWEMVRKIHEPASQGLQVGLAFHPQEPILATLGQDDTVIRVWQMDIDAMLNTAPEVISVQYTNAKVVLLGNTGVGKSGLGLVLTENPYESTDSSHGRHVWIFDSQESKVGSHTEMREVLLWDLAGQPSYRLIHQLHLNEVAVALIVFDAHSDTDPFSGVHYWNRALNEAQRLQGDSALPLTKFLVLARVDRGGINASTQRIDSLVKDLGFAGYFETSARDNVQIAELAKAIQSAIDWDVMPSVSSTELFQNIKAFLVRAKQAGRLLSSMEDLYRSFLTEFTSVETEDLRDQFKTCIGRVESQGLIRRLGFGNLILLQPELLDSYAAALVMAARDESDLGSIAEMKARTGEFRMSGDERIPDKKQEELLLIATIEDLLYHEIALREESEGGAYLVFPSQFRRELPDVSDPEGKAITFEFEGAVQNIYSRLVVRLSHSDLFKKRELWQNAAIYTTHTDSSCGMLLRQPEENGKAELTLFFNADASEEMCFQFEEYIHTYLQRQIPSESIKRRRIFVCSTCSTTVTEQQVKLRKERGYDWIRCNVCEEKVSLLDRVERLIINGLPDDSTETEDLATAKVVEIDRAADTRRAHNTAVSILQGKIATQDYDVFLCYDSADKAAVKAIGQQLKENGILPWLDEWEQRPGIPWQRLLEQHITQIKSAAVFVGSGNDPWESPELEAFLRDFFGRGRPVIPVILKSASRRPLLPTFLKRMPWVDFREDDPSPMEQLLWGITGKRGLSGEVNTIQAGSHQDERYLAELRAKDEQIAIYQQLNIERQELSKLWITRPMTPENNQIFNGPVGNVANTNQGRQQSVQHNYPSEQRQTLAEAAKEIQDLLNQLSQTYPSSTPIEQMTIASKAVEEIEKNPQIKNRVVGALKAGGKSALQELVKHPAITILIAALEGWEQKS